jgi:hypothetical protein
MPVATPVARKEYATLTYLAQGYTNNTLVGTRLLPMVVKPNLRLKIPIWGPDSLRIYKTVRAMYANSNIVIAPDGQWILIELAEHDLAYPIDLVQTENSEVPEKRRRNTMLAQDGILMSLENNIAALCQDTNSYPASHRFTLSGTDQWNDYTNSDPIGDVEAMKMAIKADTGKSPNVLLMGSQVFDIAKNHNKLVTTNTLNQKFPATIETLQSYFGIKNVIVGESIYANAANVIGYIWGKVVIVAYINETPAATRSNEDMAFGYTFRQTGYPKVDTYESNPGKVEQVRSTDTVIPVVTSNICGAILSGVIA